MLSAKHPDLLKKRRKLRTKRPVQQVQNYERYELWDNYLILEFADRSRSRVLKLVEVFSVRIGQERRLKSNNATYFIAVIIGGGPADTNGINIPVPQP